MFYFAQEPGLLYFYCFLLHWHHAKSKGEDLPSAVIFHRSSDQNGRDSLEQDSNSPIICWWTEQDLARLFCIYSTFHLKASKCFVSSGRQQGLMLILSVLIINFHRPGSGSLASRSEGGACPGRQPDTEFASNRTRPFTCHPLLSPQISSTSLSQAGTHVSPCQWEPPQHWYLERYCEGWLTGI